MKTIDVINEVNDNLIRAKKMLIEAEHQADSLDEKSDIVAVRKKIEEAIKEILHTFYPQAPFCVKKFMAKENIKEIEHQEKVQRILYDAVEKIEKE